MWLDFHLEKLTKQFTYLGQNKLKKNYIFTSRIAGLISTVFGIQFAQFNHIVSLNGIQILVLGFQFLQIGKEVFLDDFSEFLKSNRYT